MVRLTCGRAVEAGGRYDHQREYETSWQQHSVYELTVVTSPTRIFMGSSLKAKSSAVVVWEGDWENE